MNLDRTISRCRQPLERLSQPSSAAGLAALLALLIPELAEYAPVLVDLALMVMVIAIGAAIVAMVKCECRDRNGRRWLHLKPRGWWGSRTGSSCGRSTRPRSGASW